MRSGTDSGTNKRSSDGYKKDIINQAKHFDSTSITNASSTTDQTQ
jgi:hypothetical protein